MSDDEKLIDVHSVECPEVFCKADIAHPCKRGDTYDAYHYDHKVHRARFRKLVLIVFAQEGIA